MRRRTHRWPRHFIIFCFASGRSGVCDGRRFDSTDCVPMTHLPACHPGVHPPPSEEPPMEPASPDPIPLPGRTQPRPRKRGTNVPIPIVVGIICLGLGIAGGIVLAEVVNEKKKTVTNGDGRGAEDGMGSRSSQAGRQGKGRVAGRAARKGRWWARRQGRRKGGGGGPGGGGGGGFGGFSKIQLDQLVRCARSPSRPSRLRFSFRRRRRNNSPSNWPGSRPRTNSATTRPGPSSMRSQRFSSPTRRRSRTLVSCGRATPPAPPDPNNNPLKGSDRLKSLQSTLGK